MSAARPKAPPIQRDWLSKTVAGTLLGFTLALAASGLLNTAIAAIGLNTRSQLVMWLVPVVWFITLSLCYLFRSGARTWLWLGAANALVFALWGLVSFAQR